MHTRRCSVGIYISITIKDSLIYYAAIHVDFSLPPGKLTYEVVESAGNLEVCLELANVGSYNRNSTLNTPVSVHLSTIQIDHTMYEQG